jgi:hypothetical protein
MKRQYSIRIGSSIRFVAVPLMCAGMILSSLNAGAQEPIPFKAMMQSASAPAAVPAKSQSSQRVNSGPITKTGKTEIGVGYFLLGAGVVTIIGTAAVSASGYGPRGAKSAALYGGGAGTMAVGVTLITLGYHRHRAR